MVIQVGYSVTGRSRGQVTLSVVCTMHVETRSADFLVEPQNQDQRFVSGFEPVWPQNNWDGFLRFDLKTGGDGFICFDLKTGGDGFSQFGIKIGGGFLY
jgi:hypothetical protein